VIVTHALGATLSWLSLAMGAPLPPRDRDAEFRTVADAGFAAWTEDMIARCLAVLDTGPWDPSRIGTPDWSPRLPRSRRRPPTPPAHALSHLGEHVGHLHMTRELLR
jgi:hypothetical protein